MSELARQFVSITQSEEKFRNQVGMILEMLINTAKGQDPEFFERTGDFPEDLKAKLLATYSTEDIQNIFQIQEELLDEVYSQEQLKALVDFRLANPWYDDLSELLQQKSADRLQPINIEIGKRAEKIVMEWADEDKKMTIVE